MLSILPQPALPWDRFSCSHVPGRSPPSQPSLQILAPTGLALWPLGSSLLPAVLPLSLFSCFSQHKFHAISGQNPPHSQGVSLLVPTSTTPHGLTTTDTMVAFVGNMSLAESELPPPCRSPHPGLHLRKIPGQSTWPLTCWLGC